MFKKIAIAASLAILSSAAMAAPAFYAGADIGSTKPSGGDRDTSYGAFGGMQFNQNVALEVGYRSLADTNDGSADQFHVSAVGTLPLSNGFNVFGRLGVNRLSFEDGPFSEHQVRALYGAGVGYAFTPTIMGRLEVQKPNSDITNISAGVSFRF